MSEQQNGQGTYSPRVSIITIFLNGEAFLAQAIESVIAQTYSNWEYLLVDDGSGATATAIAKEYAAIILEKPDISNTRLTLTAA